jgi:hypothetical protein
MVELNLSWLKANCQMIHYFGLGFIQVKLDKAQRLHFYTDLLPPIVSEEDVHNHRYDFTSKILKGSLTQEIYELMDGDTHLVEDESCQAGVMAESNPKSCAIKLSSSHTYVAGSEYFIGHDTFHRVSNCGSCVTLLTRSNYKKEFAQVIRPIDEEKTCPFSKKIEEKELWKIVGKMLESYAN